MSTRRNFFATLIAPLITRFLPKPQPVDPIIEQAQRRFIMQKLYKDAWRRAADKELQFISGAQWPACERVINLIDPDGSKRQVTINDGL